MTRAILVLVALLALTATSCGGLDDAKKCAEGTGDLDLDIEHCTRAIDSGDLSDENVAIIFNNRGFAYHEKGEYEWAIAYYDLAIQLNPDNAYPLSNRGKAYAHKGEYDRAIADYDQVIRLKPDLALAFYNRGIAFQRKGEYDRAIRDYDRAIELKPDYANAFINRGVAYHEKGEYDRAIRDYDQAIRDYDQPIRLKPQRANTFNSRGNAYAHKGEYDRAIRDYDRAIELKPDYANAFNNKAWVLATARNSYIRDGQEAVRLAQEAVRLNDHPEFRDTLAAAYAEAGRFADAVAEQERVIEMAQAAGMHDQIADFQSRLDLYRRRQAYRE